MKKKTCSTGPLERKTRTSTHVTFSNPIWFGSRYFATFNIVERVIFPDSARGASFVGFVVSVFFAKKC